MAIMRKFYLLLFLILITYTSNFAQSRFSEILNNFESEGQKRILALEDGGYITKELDADWNAKQCYIIITRFNACSQEIWAKKIDPSGMPLSDPAQDSLNLLHGLYNNLNFSETSDHGFLLIYTSGVKIFGSAISFITKLDSLGNVMWGRQINPIIHADFSERYPVLQSCTGSRDGGCVILGYSDSINPHVTLHSNYQYLYLLKLDATGKIVWSKTYSLRDTSNYNFFSIFGKLLLLKDGGFLFYYMNEPSVTLFRIDNNGNILWEKYLSNGPVSVGPQELYELFGAEDVDKNIYLSGTGYITRDTGVYISESTISGTLAGLSPFLLKLDSNGKQKWFDAYIGPYALNKELANLDLIVNRGNKPVLVNHSLNSSISNNFLFLCTDTSGKPIWNKGLGNIYGIIPGGNGGNDFINCQTTTDSGFIFISPAQDSVYSMINKIDKNGLSACNETDISVKRVSGNISITNATLSQPLPGFTISNSTVVVKPMREKVKMACSDHFIPQADISPDTILCLAKFYTLRKGAQNAGSKTYWSTGDTTDSIVITKSGKYWLQLSSGYCTSSDTVTVVFKSSFKTGLPKKTSFCPHDSTILKVNNFTATYTGSSLWYWITPKKDTIAGDSIIANDTGYYYIMLVGTQCPNMDTLHVKYYPLPSASAGPDTTLCYDETYTMQGSGGVSYTWHPAVYLSSATDPKAHANLLNTEYYTLIVRNVQGCQDSSPVLLKVHPKLDVKVITNNTSVCYGGAIILLAKASGGDSLHYQFNWTNDNLTGDSITVKAYQTAWHTVVLSDNCTPASASDSVFLTVNPQAKAAYVYSPAIKVKINHSVNFLNQSTNASSYLWTFGTNDSSKSVSPGYIYTDSGVYKVILVAYGLNNCPNDTAIGFIKIISDQVSINIPNAFSPNGDGINDYFDITGVGIKSYSYNIYNRWGECVHSEQILLPPFQGGFASNPHGWDGNFKGGQVSDGIYMYMLDITDVDGIHHFISGNITLIR